MDKTKPYEVISTRFNVSSESAKYFLLHIQKRFKTVKPPQQLIVDFMKDKTFAFLPKPHQVAAQMYADGVWVHPLYAAPDDELEDEEDIYF